MRKNSKGIYLSDIITIIVSVSTKTMYYNKYKSTARFTDLRCCDYSLLRKRVFSRLHEANKGIRKQSDMHLLIA